ncbi:hypothetical protein Tco_0968624, partial [Tanacetum coccineum]
VAITPVDHVLWYGSSPSRLYCCCSLRVLLYVRFSSSLAYLKVEAGLWFGRTATGDVSITLGAGRITAALIGNVTLDVHRWGCSIGCSHKGYLEDAAERNSINIEELENVIKYEPHFFTEVVDNHLYTLAMITKHFMLDPNGGRCGSNGGRGGSMAGRCGGWLAKSSIVSNEGCDVERLAVHRGRIVWKVVMVPVAEKLRVKDLFWVCLRDDSERFPVRQEDRLWFIEAWLGSSLVVVLNSWVEEMGGGLC